MNDTRDDEQDRNETRQGRSSGTGEAEGRELGGAREAALSETCCVAARPHARPLLVAWGARAVYVGPAFALSAHRNAVGVLAVALRGELQVARDPRDPSRGFERCRTAFVEPNRLHRLLTTREDHAFVYVDAASRERAVLRARCARRFADVSFDVAGEDALIEALGAMERTEGGWREGESRIARALGLAEATAADERMGDVVRALIDAPERDDGARVYAERASLSSSRFQHLFKDATGVPFRRFRLWMRLRRALALVVRDGASLTEAAHASGFASSAHLSAAFREMFGMAPTRLLGGAPVLVEAE